MVLVHREVVRLRNRPVRKMKRVRTRHWTERDLHTAQSADDALHGTRAKDINLVDEQHVVQGGA